MSVNHTPESDAAFLLITGSEAFRSRETAKWDTMRETLADVHVDTREVMSEISADVTNACMDLMDITA